ncbi:MAG: triphosphoribosyl-dephospho-CoA synthase [Thiothrix sp.]|nr:triphosphoribosyl-dephospho-CoA synthase [Thiothrix sp.]
MVMPEDRQARQAWIAAAFQAACEAELEALKPGNVSVYGAGHGMQVRDFVRSAAIAAPWVARQELGVGARVLGAVEATRAVVGCNTNLGIVLLCVPLACAAERLRLDQTGVSGAVAGVEKLRVALAAVLEQLDQQEAEQVFAAIRVAQPGGLGDSVTHDVREPARTGLLDIMRVAQARDRIARQYAHAFEDVLGTGLEALMQGLEQGLSLPEALSGVFLTFLAAFPDTLVQRKQGEAAARALQERAIQLLIS